MITFHTSQMATFHTTSHNGHIPHHITQNGDSQYYVPSFQKALQENHTGNKNLSSNLLKTQEMKDAMADIASEAAKKAQRREAEEEEEEDTPLHDNNSSSTRGRSQPAADNGNQVLVQRDKTADDKAEPQVKNPPVPQGRTQSTPSNNSNISRTRPSLLDDEYYTGLAKPSKDKS